MEDKATSKKSARNTPKKSNLDANEESRSKFTPGWEEKCYEYKRSLKIPPKLISIGRPSWHRKSTSLPDLDPQLSSDASETFSETNKKGGSNTTATTTTERSSSKRIKTITEKKSHPENLASVKTDSDSGTVDPKSKSIIDLLHQRVIRPTGKNKKAKNIVVQSESKILPQSNEVELMRTPGSEGNVFKSESVFETAVLKSRTRKEYKAMKTQEIIREVFGGEDRPASAPPFNAVDIVQKKQTISQQQQSEHQIPKPLTFDQQYEKYLEKMNVDYGERIRKVKNITETKNTEIIGSTLLIPKIERMDEDSLLNQDDESQDTELNECDRTIDEIKEEACDSIDRGDTPSVLSDRATPTSFSGVLKTKKSRSNRHSRRKGSSGN